MEMALVTRTGLSKIVKCLPDMSLILTIIVRQFILLILEIVMVMVREMSVIPMMITMV